VLSRLFRRRFLEELQNAHRDGRLKFFGEYTELSDPTTFAKWLAPLRQCEWVVYAKRPFAGPKAVLAYLSRYTHRVAISNRRLLACDERGVTLHRVVPTRTPIVLPREMTRHATLPCGPSAYRSSFPKHRGAPNAQPITATVPSNTGANVQIAIAHSHG
jgi:hypothetical protein